MWSVPSVFFIMKLSGSFPLISLAAVAEAGTLSPPQHIFSNPPSSSGHQIPTSYESAVLGRRILALTPLGNLATTFPADSAGDQYGVEENRPAGLGGMPHSLMDYVADCEDEGNPTLAQQWTPPYPPDKRIKSVSTASPSGFLSRLLNWLGLGSDEDGADDEDSPPKDMVPYSAANLPRFSLLGYIEKIDDVPAATLAECFVKKHPDAKYWLPGNRIHESEFVRLVVTQIYWVGGFGDRAFIGWISSDEWKGVTREEWEKVSLPGEKKGWKEWSVETADL
ncbi:hypothetical protein RRF57_002779 [Xylaria bambusicola]|uniref:CREG-like beta-barrel domain-containing protein n=1 Tax=Xylaria bambusicola TaxID=326684 RepID=A0AAN7UTC8_9PEZI